MAEINLSKYGITGTTEIVHIRPMNCYLKKKPEPIWKDSKKDR